MHFFRVLFVHQNDVGQKRQVYALLVLFQSDFDFVANWLHDFGFSKVSFEEAFLFWGSEDGGKEIDGALVVRQIVELVLIYVSKPVN